MRRSGRPPDLVHSATGPEARSDLSLRNASRGASGCPRSHDSSPGVFDAVASMLCGDAVAAFFPAGRSDEQVRSGPEANRQGSHRRHVLRKHRSHDEQPADDTPQRFNPRAASIRVHADHRPWRDRAQRRQAPADHQGRARHSDPGTHCRRSDGPGALPAAAARRLERTPGGRGRIGHAQRIQRRFRMERLRRAAGLRVRIAEQGRAEPAALDVLATRSAAG